MARVILKPESNAKHAISARCTYLPVSTHTIHVINGSWPFSFVLHIVIKNWTVGRRAENVASMTLVEQNRGEHVLFTSAC